MSMIEIKRRKPNNKRLDKLKDSMINSNPKKFNMNLPRHIHMKFKNKCFQEGRLMAGVIRDMILNYIEK
jgi:hypothetical protein